MSRLALLEAIVPIPPQPTAEDHLGIPDSLNIPPVSFADLEAFLDGTMFVPHEPDSVTDVAVSHNIITEAADRDTSIAALHDLADSIAGFEAQALSRRLGLVSILGSPDPFLLEESALGPISHHLDDTTVRAIAQILIESPKEN